MKLLVFGSNSPLGQALTLLLQEQSIEFAALSTDEIDFSSSAELLKALARINPSQVINVATYCKIEAAEIGNEAAALCDLINTQGPSVLAEVCHTLKLPLIHHSSSNVFDGKKPQPYTEEEETNPLGRYGMSVWSGERAIRDVLDQHIILRTDWLFSPLQNQLFTMPINECKKNEGKIEVMGHRFCPTPASDIARVILAIARQLDCNAEPWGIYHYCALQALSHEQFVDSLLHEACKYDKELSAPVEALEMTITPVQKPYLSNSALNCQKIMETFGIKQRSRAAGINEVLKALAKPAKKAAKKK